MDIFYLLVLSKQLILRLLLIFFFFFFYNFMQLSGPSVLRGVNVNFKNIYFFFVF